MGEPSKPDYSPEDAEGLFQRGVALYHRGDVDKAINALEAATGADPQHAQAWCYLGLVQLTLENSNEAIIAFGSSIKANSTNPEAYIGLGFSLARQGDEESSENCFKQAMLQTLFDVEPWVFIGEFLITANIVEAEFCFNSALSIDPGDKDAQEGIRHLFDHAGANFVAGDTIQSNELAQDLDDVVGIEHDNGNLAEEVDDDDDDEDLDDEAIDELGDDEDDYDNDDDEDDEAGEDDEDALEDGDF